MKKWIYNVLFILCVVVVVYATLKIYNQKEEYKKAETEYEQLQKKEKTIDFGGLKKLNKDIVAWIKNYQEQELITLLYKEVMMKNIYIGHF